MAGLKVDSVSFVNVQKSYPPGEKLFVSYTVQNELRTSSRDWVGLFRVGWTSSRDYYTFEWAPGPIDNKGVVTFAGKRLPPEDNHFYQFCYVSSEGRVRGASPPFQFSSIVAENIDDLELVEIAEDSLMILQTKESSGKEKESELELVSVKESVARLEEEKESLISKYEVVEKESVLKSEELVEINEKVADLERQLQARKDSESRLMEKLEKEKALNQEWMAAKSDKESEICLLRQQLEEQEATIKKLEEETGNQRLEIEDLKDRLKELKEENDSMKEEDEAKFKESAIELNNLRDLQVDLMTQIGEKNKDIEQLELKKEELTLQFSTEIDKLQKERDEVLQGLSIAQQNIAELIGAKKEGVVLDIPSNQEAPPTLDETMVDKSAYEALQQAYENIEKYHHQTTQENTELRSRLHDMKHNFDISQVKNSELVFRVDKCRKEYEAKCKELFELQKNLGSSAPVHEEVASLRAKIREMEDNQEQVTVSWEEAIKELSSRKEELKQRAVKIAEMEEKIMTLEKDLCSTQQEFVNFQDKHDKVLQEKTAKLDKQQAYIDAKVLELSSVQSDNLVLVKEKAKLEHTVKQLREQLGTLKATARSPDKQCPVCSTKFPNRISQQDFERHVQGHFPNN